LGFPTSWQVWQVHNLAKRTAVMFQKSMHHLDLPNEKPVTILRDMGALQSLILNDVLPFSSQSDTGVTVLLQKVELGGRI